MEPKFHIQKDAKEPEQRMVWAEVYAPNRPDSDGEYMSAETIRKMAHDYLRNGMTKQVDVNHDNGTIEGVEIVESWIAKEGDPHFIPGSWVVGCHIPDDATWEKVLKKEINGFSVEANCVRIEKEVEVELPSEISGRTCKGEDGHEHKFFVTYTDDGVFKGGHTDVVNGHAHQIVGGTVTEETNGHRHRFSSVDPIEIFQV